LLAADCSLVAFSQVAAQALGFPFDVGVRLERFLVESLQDQ
jgi:hypothetical protein